MHAVCLERYPGCLASVIGSYCFTVVEPIVGSLHGVLLFFPLARDLASAPFVASLSGEPTWTPGVPQDILWSSAKTQKSQT